MEDPNRAALVHPQPERWPEVLELQQALADAFGHRVERPRTPQDPRCKVALSRYAEGFTQAQLLAAIAGAKHSRTIGENPEFQTLATILRDAGQVDKFARLASEDDAEGPPPEVRRRLAAAREPVTREVVTDDEQDSERAREQLARLREGIG